MSVESAGAGQGSTFTVRLPALASGANEKASSVAAPQGPRLLLVDDNRDAIDLLADDLRDAGYEVALAYDGPSALKSAAQSPPDVALIDIGLPVMSGHEVAAELRKTQGGRALRLVAISGYGQETDREQSVKAGFDLHLVKPVSLDTLLSVIEQQLHAGAPAG